MIETRALLLDFNLADDLGRELCDIISYASRTGLRLRREVLKDVKSAAELIKRYDPDLLFLILSENITQELPGLLRSIDDTLSRRPLMVVTETREPAQLFSLLKSGVADFVTPPLKAFELLPRVWRLMEHAKRTPTEEHKLKAQIGRAQLIGESRAFQEAVRNLPFIARCDSSVLISGETGTGKEVCARVVHYLGARSYRAFIPVNCGAVPTELVENELFGHERGAFTDASSEHRGLIHEADGGTLFLDEIDALPLAAQVKLLRFLQDKEYRPLGSARSRSADVRIIAAGNVEFDEAVDSGRLRRDLYYRLNVIPLRLPPLRERREDIPLLTRHFLAKYSAILKKPDIVILEDAMTALTSYAWPGNVRELEHLIERAVALCRQQIIQCEDLGLPRVRASAPKTSFREAKAKIVAQFERGYIQELLSECGGNVSQAARTAQKNRRALLHLIRKYHIDVKTFRTNSPSKAANSARGLNH